MSNGPRLRVHQMRFSFSYAGLLMAGVSQVATNPRFGIVTQLTPATFWATFILANGLILSIAMVMVHRYLASAIRCAATRCGPTLRRGWASAARQRGQPRTAAVVLSLEYALAVVTARGVPANDLPLRSRE